MQKLYTDTQGNILELPIGHLTRNMWVFFAIPDGDELARARGVERTPVGNVPSKMERYLGVDGRRLGKSMSFEFGAVWDCYIARIETETNLSGQERLL